LPNKSQHARLFFALWPNEGLVEQISSAVQKPLIDVDARRVPKSNYHITLVFYGSASAEQRLCLENAASKIRGKSFALELNRLGYWPKPKVNWLAPTEIPDALTQLQSKLSASLVSGCDYQAEQRPYRPHLTLTRKSKQKTGETGIDPIQWQVNRFVLVQSITRPEGAEYRVIKEWPLDFRE